MLWICYYKWIAHYRWTLLHVSVDQCFLAYLAPGFQLILSFYLHPCLLVHPCLLEICFSASQETHTQCITEAINIAERGGHSDARTTSITLCLIRSLEKALPMQSCQFECFFFYPAGLFLVSLCTGNWGSIQGLVCHDMIDTICIAGSCSFHSPTLLTDTMSWLTVLSVLACVVTWSLVFYDTFEFYFFYYIGYC